MLTFKAFLNTVEVFLEEMNLVHRGPPTLGWSLRRDKKGEERPVLIDNFQQLVLKNAEPYTDYDAVERGDRVVAYIRGERVKNVAIKEGGREVSYFKDKLPTPFCYVDDKSPYKGSEYAVFDGNSFKAF
jgi:hypothetical protein